MRVGEEALWYAGGVVANKMNPRYRYISCCSYLLYKVYNSYRSKYSQIRPYATKLGTYSI